MSMIPSFAVHRNPAVLKMLVVLNSTDWTSRIWISDKEFRAAKQAGRDWDAATFRDTVGFVNMTRAYGELAPLAGIPLRARSHEDMTVEAWQRVRKSRRAHD